jgi:hypothetical protein
MASGSLYLLTDRRPSATDRAPTTPISSVAVCPLSRAAAIDPATHPSDSMFKVFAVRDGRAFRRSLPCLDPDAALRSGIGSEPLPGRGDYGR